jgi:hypothetical protein
MTLLRSIAELHPNEGTRITIGTGFYFAGSGDVTMASVHEPWVRL